MFNEFPYTNFHEINLDWIIQKVKEAYSPDNPPEGIVLSVNGQDGNVILYQDAIIRFPDVQDNTWNLHRTAGGSSSGIQFLPNKAQRISGTQRLDMYDAGNPPPYPVNSVNGQTGDVTIQIPVQSVNGQTGVVVIPPDFQNSNEIMEFTQASDGNYWGLSRVVSTGTASIYLDTSNNTVKAYITYESTDGQTTVTLPLLTSADIPSSAGVVSINGQTGAVTLYGTNIYTDANSQTTISQNLAANGTAIASLQQTQSEDHTNLIQARQNITNLQGRMTTAESAEQDLMEGLAILINGNTSATGAAAGQYVYLKNSTITGAADGLYKAARAIPANTVIDVTYLTAVSAGGLNSLNDRITPNVYIGVGQVLKDNVSSTFSVYGSVSVTCANGLAVIKFTGKVETSSANQSGQVIITPAMIQSLCPSCPNLTVKAGGLADMYTSEGAYDASKIGYAGRMMPGSGNWQVARVYNTSGAVGAWAPAAFPVGYYLSGECYATY